MRVTDNSSYGTIRNSVARSREKLEQLQGQHATLRKLNVPSDDPVGAAKVLEIRTDKVNTDQFQMNSKLVLTYLENSDHALEELAGIIVRCKEIAIGQSSAASANEETRFSIAEEVKQLFQQSVAAANRKVGDRFLFGGYKTHIPAINPDGSYAGDNGEMLQELGKDVFVSMNVTGLEAFNTNPKASEDQERVNGLKQKLMGEEPSRTPASVELQPLEGQPENVNVFDEIKRLRTFLLTGDTESIRSTLERFDAIHSKIISTRAMIGSRIQGINNLTASLERTAISNAQLSSTLEDADMAQVVSDLARQETLLKSSLASSQKLIQPTLLDFVK